MTNLTGKTINVNVTELENSKGFIVSYNGHFGTLYFHKTSNGKCIVAFATNYFNGNIKDLYTYNTISAEKGNELYRQVKALPTYKSNNNKIYRKMSELHK